MTSPGSGVAADLLTITGGGGGVTAGASAKLLLGLTNATITSVTGGSGYTSAPTVTITGVGGGSGATAVATLSGNSVSAITITNPGSGYFTTPTFSLSGGGGTGASVSANPDNFEAVGAEAITAGSGYTSAPTVTPFAVDSSAGTLTEVLPTVTAIMNDVSVEANSTVNGVGAIVLNGVNGAAASGTVTLNLAGSASGDAINGTITDGTAGGKLAVAVSGGSTWTFRGANTYTGNTTVTGATLDASNTSGSATGTGSVILAGGTLTSDSGAISGNVSADGSSVIAPGGIGNIGTLALGGLSTVSGSTLNLELGSGAGPEISNGSLLTLGSGTVSIGSGTSLVFPNGGTTTVGDDYRLIGGTIGGINLSNFNLPGAPAGQTYALSSSVDSGFIDLVVSASAAGPANLTWNDASSDNLWNTAGSSNWNNGSATTVFHAQDNVTFNDSNGSAAGRYSVALNTTVSPGSVLVSNTTGNYTISGLGSIGGTGSLTKSGTGTLTLSTPNTYTGGTIVTAGRLVILPTGATSSSRWRMGAASISNGGIVQLADNVTAGTPLGDSNVNLTSLSIANNGTLDIGNNRVIIDYSGPATDPITSIAAWIKNGFYDLTGPQIISSDITADDAASGLSYGIGYADGADGAVAGLPSGEIEIMFTLLGDANLDGTVNSEDFTPFSTNLSKNGFWDQGDFNYDGTVNSEDFTPFSANLGKSATLAAAAGTLESADSIGLANVPEPASIGLVAIAGCGLLARRRRSPR